MNMGSSGMADQITEIATRARKRWEREAKLGEQFEAETITPERYDTQRFDIWEADSGDLSTVLTLLDEVRTELAEALGDAIAYRTDSGEGGDEEDEETAARYRRLAAKLGLEVHD